jgi:hypothetical protein
MVFEMPGRGDHETIPLVAALKELEQIAATKGLDPFLCPEDGKPEGMVLPEHPLEEIVDIVIGGVFDHPDLLEDHRPLPVELRFVEARPGKEIGQEIDRQLQMVIRDLDVEGGLLLPESMAEAISKAERRSVPLNSMCSMKWAAPLVRPVSWREPPSTQAPMETDRTWSISSEITRMPFSNMVLLTIGP